MGKRIENAQGRNGDCPLGWLGGSFTVMFEKDLKEQKEQIRQILMRRAFKQKRKNRWKGLEARHTWSKYLRHVEGIWCG